MCTACLCKCGSRHVRSMLPLRWNPSKYLQTDPETRSNPCGIGTRSQATAIDPPISIARKMHKDKLNINAPVSTMQPGNLSEQKWGCDPSTRASNMGDSFGTCAVNGKHQTVRETIVQETVKHQTASGDRETSKRSPPGTEPLNREANSVANHVWHDEIFTNISPHSVLRHSLSAIVFSSLFWWAFLSPLLGSS